MEHRVDSATRAQLRPAAALVTAMARVGYLWMSRSCKRSTWAAGTFPVLRTCLRAAGEGRLPL